MLSIRIRSMVLFAAGVSAALIFSAVFVGVRARAAGGAAESTFVPVSPCRLFDYRPAPDTVGPRTSPLGPQETEIQQVTGSVGDCAVPAGASGVAMNVTIVSPTAPSFLTLFPADDDAKPLASHLNWIAGQAPTPNKVDVPLSPTGGIKIYNEAGAVFVLADVVGYYTTAGLDALRDVTVELSGDMLQLTQGNPAVRSTQNSCVSSYDDRIGVVPLTIPRGALITAITANTYDAFGAGVYTVSVRRQEFSSSGLGSTTIATATLGSTSGGVSTDITPPSETADAGETFVVQLDDGDGADAAFGNGALCSLTVSYRLPAG